MKGSWLFGEIQWLFISFVGLKCGSRVAWDHCGDLGVIRSNFMDRNFSLKKTQLCHLQQVIQIFSLLFLSLKRE